MPSQVYSSFAEQAVCAWRIKSVAVDHVVATVDRTDYELWLQTESPMDEWVGRRIRGVIVLPVWKVDRVAAGGQYIEPVMGRPRRVQGRVTAVSAEANQLVVRVGACTMLGQLADRYAAGDYAVGQLVVMEISQGSQFQPTGSSVTANDQRRN